MSAAASALALGGFVLGALIGRRSARHLSHRPRGWLVTALAVEAALLALVTVLVASGLPTDRQGTHACVVLLAATAGLQNSTVRHLGVRDLNTSVLTLTLTGLTADSALGGGAGAQAHRRLGSLAAMFCGAAVAVALMRISATAVLAVAALLVALVSAAFAAPGPASARAAP